MTSFLCEAQGRWELALCLGDMQRLIEVEVKQSAAATFILAGQRVMKAAPVELPQPVVVSETASAEGAEQPRRSGWWRKR